MNNISENTRCTGCGLCKHICPVDAISIGLNSEGFYRPTVNHDICVSCKLCIKGCHEHHDCRTNIIKNVYDVKSKDKYTIINSSSGGVFSELAKSIINIGGIVVAANLDFKQENICRHIAINSFDRISLLQKSKYIQSDFQDVYDILGNFNGPILVVGTPCQCASVRRFIYLKKLSNIYVVDFICHGVGSPLVFKYYVNSLLSEIGEVQHIDFRHKITGSDSYFYIKGTKSEKIIQNYTEGYPYAFASGIVIDRDCIDCKYSNELRCSDITLADNVGPDASGDKSTIFINTDKGMQLIEACRHAIDISERDLSEVKVNCWHLCRPNTYNPDRNKFFRDFIEGKNYNKIFSKYFKKSGYINLRIRRIKNVIKRFLNL